MKKNQWVYVGCCHRTVHDGQVLTNDETLELCSLNISTKPYDTKNEMLDAVIKRCKENKDFDNGNK